MIVIIVYSYIVSVVYPNETHRRGIIEPGEYGQKILKCGKDLYIVSKMVALKRAGLLVMR